MPPAPPPALRPTLAPALRRAADTALRPPWRGPVLVWAGLLALLALNLVLVHLPLGAARPFLVVAVAAVQGGLILWRSMDVAAGDGLVRLFAFLGFFFVAVLIALTVFDYATRYYAY